MVVQKAERKQYSRFFYRFENGESSADVYDRVTVFEDHLVRDMQAGRFRPDDNVVIVTHGLTLRVFLTRWFHWTVVDSERVGNPANCQPLVLERRDALCEAEAARMRVTPGRQHTKAMYALSAESAALVCARDPALARMLDPRADALSKLRASIDARVTRRETKAEAEQTSARMQGRRHDVTPLR